MSTDQISSIKRDETLDEIWDAADDEGTIQAADMLALFPHGDPRWHTTCSMRIAMSHLGLTDEQIEAYIESRV
jgi:hypothetical protein